MGNSRTCGRLPRWARCTWCGRPWATGRLVWRESGDHVGERVPGVGEVSKTLPSSTKPTDTPAEACSAEARRWWVRLGTRSAGDWVWPPPSHRHHGRFLPFAWAAAARSLRRAGVCPRRPGFRGESASAPLSTRMTLHAARSRPLCRKRESRALDLFLAGRRQTCGTRKRAKVKMSTEKAKFNG